MFERFWHHIQRGRRTETVPSGPHRLIAKFDAASRRSVFKVGKFDGNGAYIVSIDRMITGGELKLRNGLGSLGSIAAIPERLVCTYEVSQLICGSKQPLSVAASIASGVGYKSPT